MCGLAGFVGRSTDQLKQLAKYWLHSLKHRGPDSDGIWHNSESSILFTHSRLSILELSEAGSQPMLSESGRYLLVYNGEIYNHREIRRQHHSSTLFRGDCDTETLLAEIDRVGVEECVESLNGMFAFALWDFQTNELSLFRDRCGIKPLFYTYQRGSLYFASELNCFRVIPGGEFSISQDALASYFRYGFIPGPSTIYEQVFELPPGHFMRVKFQSDGESFSLPSPDSLVTSRYWDPIPSPFSNTQEQTFDEEEQRRLLRELLLDSVTLRTLSDVPVGTFLSGGIDSSLVTALMSRAVGTKVKTFSIGYEERAFDESSEARAIAEHLGTDHYDAIVSQEDIVSLINELPALYGQPFADASAIPTTLVSRLAREQVAVSLSGDGADELFLGYPKYFSSLLEPSSLLFRIPHEARVRLAKILLALNALPEGISSNSFFLAHFGRRSVVSRKLERNAQLLKELKLENLIDSFVGIQNSDSFIRDLGFQSHGKFELRQHPSRKLREQVAINDFFYYLPDCLLTKVDRASMSTSLEVRTPFLDHRIVELTFSLCFRNSKWRTNPKKILKSLLSDFVPPSLFERPKRGFDIPLRIWLRDSLRPWAEELLSNDSLARSGFMKSEYVSDTWGRYIKGSDAPLPNLWKLLCFQNWFSSSSNLSVSNHESHHLPRETAR